MLPAEEDIKTNNHSCQFSLEGALTFSSDPKSKYQLNFEHSSKSHQPAVFNSTWDFAVQPPVYNLKDVRMCFQQPFINFSTLLQGCRKCWKCAIFFLFHTYPKWTLLSIQPANPLTWKIILRVRVSYTITCFGCCLPKKEEIPSGTFLTADLWQAVRCKLCGVLPQHARGP